MPYTRRLRGSHSPRNLITVIAYSGSNVQILTATGNTAWVSASWLAVQTVPVR
jgi:hypothetical protein